MRKATVLKTAAALATAAAISVIANLPAAQAAPVGTRAALLGNATPGPVVDVWHRGRWVAPAIAGAIIGGAIIAGSRPYGPYGYYYDDEPPPPAYYYGGPPPGPGPRMCWVETGPNGATGYWRAC
jgi:hypothetical protein